MYHRKTFWPDANFSGSAALRDDLAYKLGRSAERNEDVDTALSLYRAGESAKCSERIVRLLLRVRWVLDPNQAYVVVDVETTGGRGENHRVTEIGAVKVRGKQIVDRFQTLLNPQRSIPPNITRLTGISPAMVEQAPCFADIADEFHAFMDGAIFVAHNVDFDYRFIAAEFGRIGKPFRMPKLCTCSSMRRLYPGQRSYSLDSLCRAYGIPLQQHHRAMCDAEAATELLFMINDKRRTL
jgi:DNA polymerase-3 subunit epsilon